MKNTRKKLQLSKRTLRTLNRDELSIRGGGTINIASMDRDTSCNTGCCGILGKTLVPCK